MKVTLLLGEAATAHPDGTVSILRAGINRVWGQKLPIHLIGALVVKIDAEAAESGEHTVKIRVIDSDGKDVAPKLEGSFKVGDRGGSTNIILNFNMTFPQHGRYEFSTIIDRVVYGSLSIDVSSQPPEKN
jgi:hypothetical protein